MISVSDQVKFSLQDSNPYPIPIPQIRIRYLDYKYELLTDLSLHDLGQVKGMQVEQLVRQYTHTVHRNRPT